MRFLAAAVVFLLPLAFAPGLFFYYDITPKACVLYLGAAALVAGAWFNFESLREFRASRYGRWYTYGALGLGAMTILAASSSPQKALAWQGSNWRRGGAITEIAVLAAAAMISATVCGSRPRILLVLRSLCAAGLVSGCYGIAQYFGWDPWIPKPAYEAGEGVFQIVRPPSTFGHSDYFAAFLLWPIFAGAGLWLNDSRRWRWLGAASVVSGIIAIPLGGSRGALLGLLAGACLLLGVRRVPPRAMAFAAAIFAAASVAFYISPAGARIRARVFWIGEDRAGGARLLLWRDTIRMVASAPLLGYGPDAFTAEFPQFQSKELARAYPDFYHESPHNILLDALAEQGIAGLLLLGGMMAIGAAAGWRAARSDALALALLAALVASAVAQQFVVFVIPTAFAFYLGIGLLVGLGSRQDGAEPPAFRTLRLACAAAGVLLAVVFCWTAHRAGSGDRVLLLLQQKLQTLDAEGATGAYGTAKDHRSTGVTAEIEISRMAAAAAARTTEAPAKRKFEELAIAAAFAATRLPEQRQNAWYNAAVLVAGSNDPARVEIPLRAAIAASPNWYKPHWMLARVLASAGKYEDARREARIALDLDGGKHSEVQQSLQGIVRSAVP